MLANPKLEKKIHSGRKIIGLLLIAIIVLSGATAYLFVLNQSLKNQYQMNALAMNAQNAVNALENFQGDYSTGMYNLQQELDPANNSTLFSFIYNFLFWMSLNTMEESKSFEAAISQIESYNNYANSTAYDQILQIVQATLAQVQWQCNAFKTGEMTSMNMAPILIQYYNVAGLDDSIGQLTGLSGILFSIMGLQGYWFLKSNNLNSNWSPTPHVSLNFALANATELNATMAETYTYYNPYGTPSDPDASP